MAWVTVRDADDPVWQSIQLPQDVVTRIQKDLAAGYTVIMPTKSVTLSGRRTVGWWRVNPSNGEILGIGERGWGQAAEVEQMLATVVTQVVASKDPT